MKIKSGSIKFVSLFMAFLMLVSFNSAAAYAVETPTDAPVEEITHALVLTSEKLTVVEGKTVQMTAKVTNVTSQPKISWSSSEPGVASVNGSGLVKGISVGKSVITAQAVVDGETLTGEFTINVVTESGAFKDLLERRQILSYQYSYIDDYYYTNDKEAWQYNFGFGKIYDFVAPYLLLEYDYVRIFFLYEGKDWMLQMWKGQYGMIFYGGEIGIYNKEHTGQEVKEWTMFNCPAEEDWLNMEMTLWHEDLNGNWNREFTREYDKYWWCTGFKNGHLRQEEPADELRMTGRITFKDEEMAKIVADGLVECGFAKSSQKDSIGIDTIYLDGSDVHFCWQNISDAESTMAIKIGVGFLSSLYFLPIMPFILPFVGLFTVVVLIASAIV